MRWNNYLEVWMLEEHDEDFGLLTKFIAALPEGTRYSVANEKHVWTRTANGNKTESGSEYPMRDVGSSVFDKFTELTIHD